MGRQDASIKGNPFEATWDEGEQLWHVRSASQAGRVYRVGSHLGPCDCDAPGMCWHREIIPLAEQIVSTQAAARSYYAGWRLPDLEAEDERLREELESDDGWFVCAQYSVVGDEILDRLIGAEVAA